jgi:cytochrome c-type biogenesis protein CcmE
MKKIHIIGLVIIAVAIGVIISSSQDYSTYSTFDVAEETPDKEFHIVGKLDKTVSQKYDPKIDPNHFEFYMYDEKNNGVEVVYQGAKPDGFDQTEKIVVIGKMGKGHFDAAKILMKCPSKYVDQNKQINA